MQVPHLMTISRLVITIICSEEICIVDIKRDHWKQEKLSQAIYRNLSYCRITHRYIESDQKIKKTMFVTIVATFT